MKKDIGIIQMGITFAGCFLGAGYVSGQELWQYFGTYGKAGFAGLLLAIILLVAVTVIIMHIAIAGGKESMDEVISPFDSAPVKGFFGWAGVFMFFSIGAIMTAGIGGLAVSLLGIPAWPGCFIVSVLAAFVAFFGLNGMIAVFSLSVPFLIVTAAVICIARICGMNVSGISFSEISENRMLGPWPFAAVNYMAFNIYGSIALLSPLAKRVKGGLKGIAVGISAGGVSLFVIAFLILVALSGTRSAVGEELPMLEIAKMISPAAAWIYGVLIFLAMFGISQSSMVAVVSHLEFKGIVSGRNKVITVAVLGFLNFLASLLGFSNLIGYAYPVFGYIGSISVILLIINDIKIRRSH